MSKAGHVTSTDPAMARDLHSMCDLLHAWFVLSGCYASVSTRRNSLSRYTGRGSIQPPTGEQLCKSNAAFFDKDKSEDRVKGRRLTPSYR